MESRPERGRVCVIYTGGTVGVRSIERELYRDEPLMLAPGALEEELKGKCKVDCTFDVKSVHDDHGVAVPARPSSQFGPQQWRQIARTVERHYDAYDGFVVLHGTDTMAWTASALSFMFGNLAKPVVLTGSQRPISAPASDALANVESSLMLAARAHDSIPTIPEVIICFGDQVLRGNRSTKVSAASLQGFDTPNAPRLGRVGRRLDLEPEQIRTAPGHTDGFYVRSELNMEVADVMLYPGMPAAMLESALAGKAGAVLRTFGAGNAPGGEEVLTVLRNAARDTVLVNVTQADEGLVEAGMLTGTRELTDCGVLSGLDLTAEAALTKLMVLLGSEAPAVAAAQMQLDQRGEQSMDLVELRARSTEPDGDGVSRFVLTPALHGRARPDVLASAVLRLTGVVPDDFPEDATVTVHLNRWGAGRDSPPDARTEQPAGLRRVRGGSNAGLVLDVTTRCRQVLQTGGPVTLTVVPSTLAHAPVAVDAVLSMFMQRAITDLS